MLDIEFRSRFWALCHGLLSGKVKSGFSAIDILWTVAIAIMLSWNGF